MYTGMCKRTSAFQRVELMRTVSSWAIREDVPFIRAVRSIPTVMKQRLPAEYLKALDTTVRFLPIIYPIKLRILIVALETGPPPPDDS